MDLRPIETPASPAERTTIEAAIARDPLGSAARTKRHLLLPALHAVQRRFGYVSEGALGHICRALHLPPAEAYGVASFYALFALKPRAPEVVHVCDDLACKSRGADTMLAGLEARQGHPGHEHEGRTWLRSACLGLCEHAPAALVQRAGEAPVELGVGPLDAAALEALVAGGPPTPYARAQLGQPRSALHLLRRVGVIDPSSLDDYRAHGGYQALRRAFELGPAGVIREVTEAKLVGRGGAAFPTGRKWAAVAAQPVRPHYLVCNADESEPGTFKDRILMEEDPYSVVEALTIAGYATGCAQGFVYIRGEYPRAKARMSHAIAEARARGLLGPDILGRGYTLELTVLDGAGAYICGEETALFASIEGYRGEPRSKPPFPVEVGLFGKPTVVNNVETLANVVDIVRSGAASFAAKGTPGSAGTKLFCVSGHVERPGLFEVPLGTPLDQLIAQAGGVRGGAGLGAVLLGGAAGTFLTPEQVNVPLTFEDTRKLGATLGSGVVFVLDDGAELAGMLRRLAGFFRDESCGQCVPCRVGTVRVEELLDRLERRAPLGSVADELVTLRELGMAMRDASICGLGQTATSAVESAISRLPIVREAAARRGEVS